MHSETPFISVDKFKLEPEAEIQKQLHEKLKSKPTKTALIKQLYIYGSSVAALFILLFLTYTYFFQDSNTIEKNPIAEIKQKKKPTQSTKKQEPENINSSENERKVLAKTEKKKEFKKSASKRALPKIKEVEEEQSSFAVNPEEFNALTSEIIIDEIEGDATLAYFSDESERAFHYYTRVE